MNFLKTLICGAIFFWSLQDAVAGRQSHMVYDGPEFYLKAVLEGNFDSWDIKEFEFHYKRPAFGFNPYTTYQRTLHYLGDKEFSLGLNSLERTEQLYTTTAMRGFSHSENESVELTFLAEKKPESTKIIRIELFPQTGEIVFYPEHSPSHFVEHARGWYMDRQVFRRLNFKAQTTYYVLSPTATAQQQTVTRVKGTGELFHFTASVATTPEGGSMLQSLDVSTPGDMPLKKILLSPSQWSTQFGRPKKEIQFYRGEYGQSIYNNGSTFELTNGGSGRPTIRAVSPQGNEFSLSFDNTAQACAVFLGDRIRRVEVVGYEK